MSAYFIIQLDTTGPMITLDAPTFVELDEEFTIIVESSEELLISDIHELYIIDRLGIRYDLTYDVFINRIQSTLTLRDYEVNVGRATIYAALYDDVLNVSNVAFQHLTIDVPIIEQVINFKGKIDNETCLKGAISKEYSLRGSINKYMNLKGEKIVMADLKGEINKSANLKGEIGGD